MLTIVNMIVNKILFFSNDRFFQKWSVFKNNRIKVANRFQKNDRSLKTIEKWNKQRSFNDHFQKQLTTLVHDIHSTSECRVTHKGWDCKDVFWCSVLWNLVLNGLFNICQKKFITVAGNHEYKKTDPKVSSSG